MKVISPEQAKAYLSRWQLVRQAEEAELERTSVDVKFRQLAALMTTQDAFADDPQRQAEIQAVRERWARLREAIGA
jgi:Fe-S-cluster formation regulator IscX/YfhJ